MPAAPPSTSLSVPSRPTFACIRCSERKVKCDRQRPCGACANHKVDCVFQPPRPPQKRHRHVEVQVLVDRLRTYETLLKEQGIDANKLPDNPGSSQRRRSSQPVTETSKDSQLQAPSSTNSDTTGSISKPQVLQSQEHSMFVDNSLWSRVVEEFHDPEDALENCSNDSSYSEASDDDFGFVLNTQPKSSTRFQHPTPEHIYELWQVFVENIDPLTKVVHVPTLLPAVQAVASNTGSIPRSVEALMFAIYSASVMSLSDDDCKQRLGESRKILLSRYISATKRALRRAKFMGTTSLVVLQALVLHLLSVRDIYEPRTVWSLTGVAVRIAQGMGLDCDGLSLGLSPFETEMRRRIWWMLKTHDYRTAELCGLHKFRDLDIGPNSTKRPTNVNDDQLYPGMPLLPAESETLTDMAFVALRCELSNYSAHRVAKFRQQGKDSSQWDRDLASGHNKAETDEAFKEVEGLLETKYLRYCDPSQPLHLITMLMARSALNTILFLTHHPRRWASIEQTPLAERQWVWDISIKLLEKHNMLQSNPMLKRYAWQGASVMQWHAFIHVLDILRANPLTADAEKAWELVGNTYENNTDMVFNTRKPIHVAVARLCLEAYSAREAALLKNENLRPPPTPKFILQLRQQRELIKAKKQPRVSASSQAVDPVQARAHYIDQRLHGSATYSSDALESMHPHQNTPAHDSSFDQTGSGAAEGDPFWFVNGFDDGPIGDLNHEMELDLDSMLAQDHSSVEDVGSQTITWEHWDTWIAGSNTEHQ